jgi:hypothetical protein
MNTQTKRIFWDGDHVVVPQKEKSINLMRALYLLLIYYTRNFAIPHQWRSYCSHLTSSYVRSSAITYYWKLNGRRLG